MARKDWMSEAFVGGNSRQMEKQMQKLRDGKVFKNKRNHCAEG